MKYKLKSIVFLLVLLICGINSFSQNFNIEEVPNAESAVMDILLPHNYADKGIKDPINFEWSGGISIGKYNNLIKKDYNYSNGLVISTGNKNEIIGSTSEDASSIGSGIIDTAVIRELLFKGSDAFDSVAHDIAYIKFDFVPISDTVKLKLMFASEEYPEKATGELHDRFGIFITGEKPEFKNKDTLERYDTVDCTREDFAQVDLIMKNINETSHPEYYVDGYIYPDMRFDGMMAVKSEDGAGGVPQPPDYIELNIPVNPCSDEPYTIFIVIADAVDSLFDSAIFIEEGSFTTNHRQNEIEVMDVELFRNVVVCPEIGDTAMLHAEAEGGWGHYLYTWYKGDGSSQSGTDSTYLVNSLEETTTMYVEATDICDVSEMSNTVQLKLQCPITIANVLTPNNDGYNDWFKVENIEQYENVTMVIYNRYGKKIWETNHYENENWDGGDHPDGTYFYVLRFKINGEEKEAKGSVTIIRN